MFQKSIPKLWKVNVTQFLTAPQISRHGYSSDIISGAIFLLPISRKSSLNVHGLSQFEKDSLHTVNGIPETKHFRTEWLISGRKCCSNAYQRRHIFTSAVPRKLTPNVHILRARSTFNIVRNLNFTLNHWISGRKHSSDLATPPMSSSSSLYFAKKIRI